MKTIYQVYEDEMKHELESHDIPHSAEIDGYKVSWYPQSIEDTVEYILTVTGSSKTIKGSFEQWKKSHGYL